MIHWTRKNRRHDRLQVKWPEVNLNEQDLQRYFQFLLLPHVFSNQIPFLFGPPFDEPEMHQHPGPGH